jgi:uncharacterized protein (TIGR02145 family)
MKKIVLVITMLGIILSCQKEEIDPKQTVTDIDGNQYRTIQIGTQVWMAENLKSSKYCNGDPIPNINDAIQWSNLTTGAWSIYPIQILHSYGKFYNWYAVDDARNICPCNWHVPTDAEWTVLLEFLEWKEYRDQGLKRSRKRLILTKRAKYFSNNSTDVIPLSVNANFLHYQ